MLLQCKTYHKNVTNAKTTRYNLKLKSEKKSVSRQIMKIK